MTLCFFKHRDNFSSIFSSRMSVSWRARYIYIWISCITSTFWFVSHSAYYDKHSLSFCQTMYPLIGPSVCLCVYLPTYWLTYILSVRLFTLSVPFYMYIPLGASIYQFITHSYIYICLPMHASHIHHCHTVLVTEWRRCHRCRWSVVCLCLNCSL